MAFALLSGTNGFIPKATGQVIGYVRKPSQFPINDYVQYIKSDKVQAIYAKISRDEPVRVTTDAAYTWHDGQEAPNTDDGSVPFEFLPIRIVRRRYNWLLGYDAIDNAEGIWEPKLIHVAAASSKAMVNRTAATLSVLETAANWQGNTAAIQSFANINAAATWQNSTSLEDASGTNEDRRAIISKSHNEIARRVHLNTNNVIQVNDLRCLINSEAAVAVAQSGEVRGYLRESPYALPELTYEDRAFAQLWGLHRYYQGIMWVVDSTVRVTRKPKSDLSDTTYPTDSTRAEIKNSNTAIYMSRPGGIDGEFGAPSYSTMQIYYYKHLLTVRAFDEPVNLRVKGDVIDQFAPILAAPNSGFLATNILTTS